MKLIIISNRLPVKALRKDDGYHFTLSEGGLATGLNSLRSSVKKFWIGWPEAYPETPADEAQITDYLNRHDFHPVFLTPSQIRGYYEGYSNSILWPLCHYFYSYIDYENDYWQATVQRKSRRLRQKFGERKLILSVDRLDYSKGILHRLRGFELFLENHPRKTSDVTERQRFLYSLCLRSFWFLYRPCSAEFFRHRP